MILVRDGSFMQLNKRILYITPGFPSDESDSTCIPALQEFMVEIGNKLGKQQIISLNYPKAGEYNWFGHSVKSLGWNNPVKVQKVLLFKFCLPMLKKFIDENPCDLIHSFWMTDASWLGAQLASYAQVPHVVTIMGQDVKPSLAFKRILRTKPKLITLSPFQDRLVQTYGQTTLIPWGLSDKWIPKGTNEKEIDIVTVGSLIDVKRPVQLIELVMELKKDFPSIRAVYIGDGPQRKALEHKCAALGLDDNIEFLGERNRAETLRNIAKARLLFHPSMYEGFGMVIIEALALGTQPISYSTGIANEIEKVLKINNLEEGVKVAGAYLASKVSTFQFDSNFNIRNTVEKYEDVYNEKQAYISARSKN